MAPALRCACCAVTVRSAKFLRQACTENYELVYVKLSCYSRVAWSKALGYQPKHGPRLWTIDQRRPTHIQESEP